MLLITQRRNVYIPFMGLPVVFFLNFHILLHVGYVIASSNYKLWVKTKSKKKDI